MRGSSGQMLHAGNTNPASVGKYYEMRNGRVHTHSNINVAWQLNATHEGDGGFCIIPGVLVPLVPELLSLRSVCSH